MIDERKHYKLALRNHWWIDSGIAGLFNIAWQNGIALKNDIIMEPVQDGLVLTYTSEDNLRQFLQDCYEELASRYWNVSTKKQRGEPNAVFYNRSRDELELKPKRNPTPIPALFTKGSSWRLPDDTSGIALKDLELSLRVRVEEFLRQNKVKLWGSKKILLLKAPVCHKQLKILPAEKKRKNICSVCGCLSSHLSTISQPSYLLFASNSATRSFNSEASAPEKICWECELVSKFAVESASYKKKLKRKRFETTGGTSDYDVFIVQVVSSDLKKIINISKKFGSLSVMREIEENNFFCNIRSDEKSLITYATLPYEFLWAFYSDAYRTLKSAWEQKQVPNSGSFLDELLGLSLEDAPIQFVLLVIANKGQTFITKDLIFYDDTAYVFRLQNLMEQCEVDSRFLFNSLYNQVDKDKAHNFRNQFFYNVLNKRSVVLDTESFAFHVTMLSKEEQPVFLQEVLKFIQIYETTVGVTKMTDEQVKVAVNLGKAIVLQAQESLDGDEFKKVKGDLFTLRKTRTKTDFLSQINTLQLRYGLTVSGRITEGILERVPFEEFKAYCMLGALNVYNSVSKVRKNEGGK